MKKKNDVKILKKTRKRIKTFKIIKKTFTILISLVNIAIVLYGLYTNFAKKEDEAK